MNINLQGFIARTTKNEILVELESLEDLVLQHQELLRSLHRQPDSVWCRCGKGQRHFLQVFKWPYDDILGLRRVIADEHQEFCIFTQFRDGHVKERIYSASIFAPETPAIDLLESLVQGVAFPYSKEEHYTFSRFCCTSLSRAQVLAWQTANQSDSHSPLAQPTARQLLFALGDVLSRPDFPDGLNAYAAAKSTGAALTFGLVSQAPKPVGVAGLLALEAYIQGSLRSVLVLVPETVWLRGRGDALADGDLLAPPYLYFAAIEPNGIIRKLRIYPVMADGTFLIPVESGYERAFARFLLRESCVFIKPVLRQDAVSLLRHYGIAEPQFLRFRNDFWVVRRRSTGRLHFYPTELRGYRPGRFPEYDRDIERKRGEVLTWGPDFEFKDPNGWDYSYTPEPVISWTGIPSTWHGPMPAVTAWLSRHGA